MKSIIFTPRLKLTMVTKAERGSQELAWLHKLRSDEQATWWSIYGRAKTIQDTEKVMKGYLPPDGGEDESYRVVYAVHKVLDLMATDPTFAEHQGTRTEFLGLVLLRSLEGGGLVLPEELALPAAAAATTLTVELAYWFLPAAWGQGYATESVAAVFEACRKAKSFWEPFSKVYIRAIVNGGNPLSMRVMEKTGMAKRGVYDWTGEIFLAGEWRTQDSLHIYGMHLLE